MSDLLQSLFYWVINTIKDFGDTILEMIPNVFAFLGGDQPLINTTYGIINSINYFFPLSELVSYSSIILTTWLLIIPYRIIKSWIPTVSS